MNPANYHPDWDWMSRQIRDQADNRCQNSEKSAGFGIFGGTAPVLLTPMPPLTARDLRGGSRAMPEHTQISVWRPVVGFEGVYEVSADGLVRRVLANRGSRGGNIIAPQMNGSNYPAVHLWRDNKRCRRYVHRIVAEAFLGVCPPGHEVNHKNGMRDDPRAANLEYVTRSSNIRHAMRVTGAFHGERHPGSKLQNESVRRIRREMPRSESEQRRLAQELGVSWMTVRRVASGKGWEHVDADRPE